MCQAILLFISDLIIWSLGSFFTFTLISLLKDLLILFSFWKDQDFSYLLQGINVQLYPNGSVFSIQLNVFFLNFPTTKPCKS